VQDQVAPVTAARVRAATRAVAAKAVVRAAKDAMGQAGLLAKAVRVVAAANAVRVVAAARAVPAVAVAKAVRAVKAVAVVRVVRAVRVVAGGTVGLVRVVRDVAVSSPRLRWTRRRSPMRSGRRVSPSADVEG
jgi:hypothetical protein